MGLAASQARLLFVTARKSDVEFNLMKIANRKIGLSRDAADLSRAYADSLNNRKLTISNGTTNMDLTYGALMTPGTGLQYMVTNANGKVVLNDSLASKFDLGTSGAAGDMKTKYPDYTAFLKKVMPGVTNYGTLIAGRSTSTNQAGTTDAYATTLSKDVSNIMASLSKLPETSNEGINTLTEPVYLAVKNSLNAIITKTGDKLQSLGFSLLDSYVNNNVVTGYISGSANAQVDATQLDYLKDIYNSARHSLELLEISKNDNHTDNTRARIAAIKGIMSGQPVSGDQGSIGGTYNSPNAWGNQGTWSRSQFDANNIIRVTAGMTGNAPPGREDVYVGNVTDLVALYTEDLSVKPEQTEADTNQSTANYYMNLYDALNSKGWVVDSNVSNSTAFQNGVRNGIYSIQKYNNGGWGSVSLSSADSPVSDVLDTEANAEAEAIYESEKAKLETKEQALDLQQKGFDTERAALDTEIDSIKSIINKNIERSFKMFQG